jgi:nitrogen regulatory protein P-II 1
MFKVEAIIQPHKLREAREALLNVGAGALTITEVKGHGRQRGHSEVYRGQEYEIAFLPKIKIEIVVTRQDVDTVVSAIARAARTGRIGDGKIFVLPVQAAIRIRNGQIDEAAL